MSVVYDFDNWSSKLYNTFHYHICRSKIFEKSLGPLVNRGRAFFAKKNEFALSVLSAS